MRSIFWFLAGLAAAIVLASVIGYALLTTSVGGFSANARPTAAETWIARKVRAMAVPNDMKQKNNPVPNSPEILSDARAHWADHCAACHGNDGSGQSEMGPHLYPPTPDMRKPDTQRMTDGELFYIIQNGIRLSGMPAWAPTIAPKTRGSSCASFGICPTSRQASSKKWRSSTQRLRKSSKKNTSILRQIITIIKWVENTAPSRSRLGLVSQLSH